MLLVTPGAMAVLGPRPRHFALRVRWCSTMLLVALYAGIIVLGGIDAIQAEVGGLPSLLPAGDARRIRFDALHAAVDAADDGEYRRRAGAALVWEARDHERQRVDRRST